MLAYNPDREAAGAASRKGDFPMPVTVNLTERELVLVRVALIRRLDLLKDRPELEGSYNDTRDLLCGKLGIQLYKKAPAGEVA